MPNYADRQSIDQALAADASARAAAPSKFLNKQHTEPVTHSAALPGQFLNAGAVMPPSIQISENAIAASNQPRVPKRDSIKFDFADEEKLPKRPSSSTSELQPPPMRYHDGRARSLASMSFDDLHEIFKLCGGSEAEVCFNLLS